MIQIWDRDEALLRLGRFNTYTCCYA